MIVDTTVHGDHKSEVYIDSKYTHFAGCIILEISAIIYQYTYYSHNTEVLIMHYHHILTPCRLEV